MWTQIGGSNKPIVKCSLFSKGEKINRLGMLDTEADVTIIARSKWPSDWELESVAGMISAIDGVTVSMRSKRNVIMRGPEGKMVTVRPFVRSSFPRATLKKPTALGTRVFILKKPGKDRWRLLHDLWKINDVIKNMGPLQPGLPSPLMLPWDWKLAVIDIKDCFLNIPLHPQDAPRFTLSVPSINRQGPLRRYHWLVLPQGMKTSPIICQWYVAHILSPVRELFSEAITLHYMDDILVCSENQPYLDATLRKIINVIEDAELEIQGDKIQHTCPWTYLGVWIHERTIIPQQVTIWDDPKTLWDLHQLCRSINWVRTLLGITTEDLALLFNLFCGSEDLDSPLRVGLSS
ncbi:hypothetical protein HGM15179_019599 [Zosterops borbonicus]|uniref:ribonuclease H n=1 Tax=Zosterops borbonicus TaxID=364589 RepID=A0A8K1FYM4_9PASS|nr:hypothetical protein HGM15179_019599 [Zosterops borbonicus]